MILQLPAEKRWKSRCSGLTTGFLEKWPPSEKVRNSTVASSDLGMVSRRNPRFEVVSPGPNRLAITVPTLQIKVNKNTALPLGIPECQAQNAPNVGRSVDDVTPADHIIAFASGLALSMETLSVRTPKKGACCISLRSPTGHPGGSPVPPTV